MTNVTAAPPGSVRFVLPPLHADQIPAGRDAADYSVLLKIANGLTLAERLDEQAQQLVSIPDVWAQVEVFRAALTEKAHPLHHRAVGEWRGLLAVFALRFSRACDVSTQRVQLGARGTGQGLLAILNKIKPAITLTRRHSWDEIGLIRVRGAVIGMLVPTTIVCPARRPPAALAARLPWITEGRILDPLAVADVDSDEIALLADFCTRAAAQLEADEEYPDDFQRRGLLSEIKGCFDDFRADAEERLNGAPRVRFNSRTLDLELPAQPLYPLLRDVMVRGPGRDSEPVSQTLLPTRPELQAAGINGILIIDPNLPQVLGARASNINVWDGTKLQTVLDEREERQRVEAEARAAGYLCLDPDDLFTTYFYRTDNAQIDAHPIGFRDALLPITPAVLMLLAPEDFPRAIELAASYDEVTVTLRLKLSDIGGRERVYTVRKRYDTRDVISRLPPTTLSFWPDFEHPDWHWHFTYYGGNPTQQFAPRMFVSMPAMAEFIERGPDAGSRVDLAARLAVEPMREPQPLADRLPLQRLAATIELYKSKLAAEALYCDFVVDATTRGFVESRDRAAAGVLLLPARRRPTSRSEPCAIGIDFGTVNTSVYQRIGGGSPTRMVFRNHSVLPFGVEQKDTYHDFLPLDDVRVPFMTVLRDRQKVDGMSVAALPLWASFVYYVTEATQPLEDLADQRDKPLHFELKWGTTKEEREPIQTFLAQVALQSLAEVVAAGVAPRNVSWRFSYPEAYSPAQRSDFVRAATAAVRIVINPDADTAAALEDPYAPRPEVTTDSESLSTALYFISEKPREAPATGDLVTIDMGGLTSDISIWHRGRLIWRNSLKLAGRHILLQYLRKDFRPDKSVDLIRRIGTGNDDIAKMIRQVADLDDDKRDHGLEMLMNSPVFAAAFVSKFHLVAGEAVGRDLIVAAEIALTGILHYVGRTMQHCAAVSSAYRDVKDAHVAVCLGGRTSLLYRALFGDGTRRSQLDASIGTLKDAAPGLVAGIDHVYSDLPKHEVAFGLLVPQRGAQRLEIDAVGFRVLDIILGEAVRSDDVLLPYDAVTSDLGTGAEWQCANLDELKSFIRSVESHSQTIMMVKLAADAERKIRSAVNNQLVNDRQRLQQLSVDGELHDSHLLSESTVIEPPFVVALRELITLVIDGEVIVQTRA